MNIPDDTLQEVLNITGEANNKAIETLQVIIEQNEISRSVNNKRDGLSVDEIVCNSNNRKTINRNVRSRQSILE